MPFQVGDKVRYLGNEWMPYGTTGYIAAVNFGTDPSTPVSYGFCSDENTGGHDLHARVEYGHGWWLTEYDANDLELIEADESSEPAFEVPEDLDILFGGQGVSKDV